MMISIKDYIKEGLLNKKNIEDIKASNKYNISEDDMKQNLKYFPVSIVIRMLEEQENQGNKPDVKVFQKTAYRGKEKGGFDWDKTPDGIGFWDKIIRKRNFNEFYSKYPEYKKYDRS